MMLISPVDFLPAQPRTSKICFERFNEGGGKTSAWRWHEACVAIQRVNSSRVGGFDAPYCLFGNLAATEEQR